MGHWAATLLIIIFWPRNCFLREKGFYVVVLRTISKWEKKAGEDRVPFHVFCSTSELKNGGTEC